MNCITQQNLAKDESLGVKKISQRDNLTKTFKERPVDVYVLSLQRRVVHARIC